MFYPRVWNTLHTIWHRDGDMDTVDWPTFRDAFGYSYPDAQYYPCGDLDRDGNLDLLYNLTHHYNVSKLTLFLSSAAKSNEIFRKVGEFVITGC